MRYFIMALSFAAAGLLHPAVTLAGGPGPWELRVDGRPYYVRGITFGAPMDKASLDGHLAMVQSTGANTIRSWGSDDLAKARLLLDGAQARGLKVMAGLWLRHGRAGAEGDDAFNWADDAKGRQAQWDSVLAQVRALKDHPALLMWGLGNEVLLNIGPDREKEAYARFLGSLAQEIKRLDPGHPIASSSAWSLDWDWWQRYAPAIEVYGVNTYGGGASVISKDAEKLKYPRPYLLTEFGARGEWDAPLDKNGLKIEPSDQEKEGTLREGFPNWVESKKGANLGGFIFNYGNELNHAGIWLNLLVDGAFRPSYWGARSAFKGLAPLNRWPEIGGFSIPKDHVDAGAWVDVDLKLQEPEGEKIAVSFHYNRREGSRAERDAVLPLASRQVSGHWQFQAPSRPGLIKVYVFARDPYPNLSIAQCSLVIR